MAARRVTGLLGIGVIVGLLLVGIWGFVDATALDVLGEYATATIASAGIVVVFVVVLSLVAIRADVLARNPYW